MTNPVYWLKRERNRSSISISLFLFTYFIGAIYYIYRVGISNESILKIAIFSVFLYCVYKGRQETSWINPYFLFSLVPLSILAYIPSLSTFYMVPLKESTLIIALLNMIFFLIPLSGSQNKFEEASVFKWNKKQIRNHSLILLFISFIPNIYKIILGAEMPFESILSLLYYPAIACAIYTKNRIFILFFSVIMILRMLDGFDKTGLLFILITVIVSLEKFIIAKKDRKKVIFIIAIIVIAFLLSFNLRDYLRAGNTVLLYFSEGVGSYNNAEYYTKNNLINWNGPNILMIPYMYFTTPWTNLQYVIESQNTRTFGLWFLKPIFGYLMIDKAFDKYYILLPYSSFNTFTFISVLFKDFGYWGSCLGSLFLGYFVNKVYRRYKASNSPFFVGCYALTASATAEMFFSNHFFGQSYPFTIIILMFIYINFIKMLKVATSKA
jgi:hypothetical protein